MSRVEESYSSSTVVTKFLSYCPVITPVPYSSSKVILFDSVIVPFVPSPFALLLYKTKPLSHVSLYPK